MPPEIRRVASAAFTESGEPARQVGRRVLRPASAELSLQALSEAFVLSGELGKLSGGSTFFPKGVFRYRSHEEANRHWDECVARGMARLAVERERG